jgi:hypothetical protein
MLPHVQLLAVIPSCVLAFACAGTQLPVTEVNSTAPDFQLQVKDAIFVHVRDPKTSAETAFIHLSDTPHACELARQNGIQFELAETRQAIPGSRWLTWTVITLDRNRRPIKNGPVAMGAPNVDQEAGRPAWFYEGMFGFAVAGTSMDRCAVEWLRHDEARLELDEYQPRPGGIAEGRFELRRGSDLVRGSFHATYCELAVLRQPDPACAR